ncbi:TetR/AcrR family transcriptional regulator [Enterococcus sp. 669A]|uniref:TetR/AcrR family transcriptional regulator n=1 Tax=Candidatus Enterococcus moelleringii TaxID=2815325 RepID=A0ABS3LF95_9ENTE|nr:TetR/AcrR family transcriptional regulator [Enterococcus sp. 669A]MBO1307396.1 TetR/AcrR family transcriptional regulator [Enterococcus sp. 669A]
MPRNKYPEETVQKILDASLRLFLEKGYEETTVLDIVNELEGLTRGAFYHHFKSKEEVLDALGTKLFWDNNPFEKVMAEKELTGLEKIKKVIKLSLQNEDQQKVGVMSISLLENPRILAEFMESNQTIAAKLFEKLFQEAIDDGSIKDIKYPKALPSLFTLLLNVWLPPAIFPGSKAEVLERLYLMKDILDSIGVPVIDDETLGYAKKTLETILTE